MSGNPLMLADCQPEQDNTAPRIKGAVASIKQIKHPLMRKNLKREAHRFERRMAKMSLRRGDDPLDLGGVFDGEAEE